MKPDTSGAGTGHSLTHSLPASTFLEPLFVDLKETQRSSCSIQLTAVWGADKVLHAVRARDCMCAFRVALAAAVKGFHVLGGLCSACTVLEESRRLGHTRATRSTDLNF